MPRRSRKQLSFHLSQESKDGILSVLFFSIALLLGLSVMGSAGSGGGAIDTILMRVFGWEKILLPVVFGIVGYSIARGAFPQWSTRVRIGIGLGIVTLFPLLSRMFNDGATGGGVIGQNIFAVIERSLGFVGANVLVVMLGVVSLLLISDHSWTFLRLVGRGILQLGSMFRDAIRSHPTSGSVPTTPSTTYSPIVTDAATPVLGSSGFLRRALRGTSTVAHPVADARTSEPVKSTVKKQPRTSNPCYDVSLLDTQSSSPTSGDTERALMIIERTFRNFGIEVEMGELKVGPTVTQYTLKPAEGVKLSQITALHNDLALALAAHPIRIEAPIPGKSLVGIEVPNQRIAIVPLRMILTSEEYTRALKSGEGSSLTICLGQDVAGTAWITDLSRMPHLLIAGATGSGKTIMLNSIIMSLLYRNSKEELRLILIDPKRVELPVYNGIPHLVTPVITDVRKTINALRWLIGEMDRRFDELSRTGHRDIHSYNAAEDATMPYMVVIVDELADLMATAAHEVEAAIIRLAQMSRAVGIHLVLATQRPSVDVITGLIKANIPARIAFSVASSIDSRTILDQPGADKLLGRGDMLFLTAELSKPKRIQGAYVTDKEIKRTVEYLRTVGTPQYDDTVVERQNGTVAGMPSESNTDDDPLLEEAKDTVIRSNKASATLLQRRLKIGYARAARLLDLLESQGIIGPGDGAKPREVLIKLMEGDTIPLGGEELSTGEEYGDEEIKR